MGCRLLRKELVHEARPIRGNTTVNVISGFAVFLLIVGAFLYFPIALDQMHLEQLMGEVTLQKGNIDDIDLIRALVQEAEYEYDIILFDEDIEIIRRAKVMELWVIWRPIIYIPIIGFEIELEKELMKRRVIL